VLVKIRYYLVQLTRAFIFFNHTPALKCSMAFKGRITVIVERWGFQLWNSVIDKDAAFTRVKTYKAVTWLPSLKLLKRILNNVAVVSYLRHDRQVVLNFFYFFNNLMTVLILLKALTGMHNYLYQRSMCGPLIVFIMRGGALWLRYNLVPRACVPSGQQRNTGSGDEKINFKKFPEE
jgi:hypothetical protein